MKHMHRTGQSPEHWGACTSHVRGPGGVRVSCPVRDCDHTHKHTLSLSLSLCFRTDLEQLHVNKGSLSSDPEIRLRLLLSHTHSFRPNTHIICDSSALLEWVWHSSLCFKRIIRDTSKCLWISLHQLIKY